MRRRRPEPLGAAGRVGIVWWGLAAAHVVDGVRLRRRRTALAALPSTGPATVAAGAPSPTVLALEGVQVDEATRAAAAQDMHATGATAVDLVPGDLPTEAMLRFLHRVDPERLRGDPLYAPAAGGHAVLVHPSVAARMGLRRTAGAGRSRTVRSPDRAQQALQTRRVHRYAPTSTVVRLAARLRAVPEVPDDRWTELEELPAEVKPLFVPAAAVAGGQLLHLAILTVGALAVPVAGWAALLAWSGKPALALGAHRWGASVRRLPRVWRLVLEDAGAGHRRWRAAARRTGAVAPPAPPPGGALFEARRSSCPWCGSDRLVGRLDTTDLLQRKPGSFHLDECASCGHIFQNPALSVEGLGYYYDDFYDGGGAEGTERAFAGLAAASNEGRIRAIARVTAPRAWLDVGAGHGHFCLMARQRWPEARFDGLDASESVEEARRRGWVDNAYRGEFPRLADRLPRIYDVVSMYHYLEHTRDPRAELAAAAKVLPPGGHLAIEVPDAASPWSRRLGRYWVCWFQPQHQHFVPCENLVAALDVAGFETVSIERGPASTGNDLTFAPLLAARSVGLDVRQPWVGGSSTTRRTDTQRTRRARRGAARALAVPTAALLQLVDRGRDLYLRRPGTMAPSNAYRIVARKR